MIRILTPVLFLLAGLCAQNDLDARLDAVKEYKGYMKRAREEALQVEAVMTLKGNECPAAVEELLKVLKGGALGVQQAALLVLGTYRDTATFQGWIDELPKLKDADLAALLIKILGQSQVKAAVPAIEETAGAAKAAANVKYEAARALRAIGTAGEKGLLGGFLTDGDASVRLAAADAVGALKLQQHADAVVALLGDGEWQVQSAAIGALGELRPQPAVQPLIDLMKKPGRLQIECAEALFKITTFDFGVDPQRWQEHWNNLMKIEGWRIPTEEELAKAKETRKKNDAFYGKKEDRKSFGGINTTSTNVLFIIDQSGSMDDLVVEAEKFQGYADRKRFTIVKTELLNTIDSLTDNTNFNIVAFATELNPWKPRLVPGNVVNREAAKAFVSRMKPLGGSESQELAAAGLGGSANLAAGKTNTFKALMFAFGIDPDNMPKGSVTGAGKEALKRSIDTVYFLSDGRPSTGKYVDTNEILGEVRRFNEAYRMVFHTIAIGEFQKEWMRALAQENGGEFIDMGR